jgi:hypothetical protein
VTGRAALEKLRVRQMPGANQDFSYQRYLVGIPIYEFQKKGLHACIATMLSAMKQSGGNMKKLARHMERNEVGEIQAQRGIDKHTGLTALKLRLVVADLIVEYAALLAVDLISIELEKKLDEREPADAAGNLGKTLFSKREKKQIIEQAHALTNAMLMKEVHALFFDAYDTLTNGLVIPGTVRQREQGCDEDKSEFGACERCGRELQLYGVEHPCYTEPHESWQCAVCSEEFVVEDELFCCDRVDKCGWYACAACQALIYYVPPSATEVAATNASDETVAAVTPAIVADAAGTLMSVAGVVAGATTSTVGVALSGVAGVAGAAGAAMGVTSPRKTDGSEGQLDTENFEFSTFDVEESQQPQASQSKWKRGGVRNKDGGGTDGIDVSAEVDQLRMQMDMEPAVAHLSTVADSSTVQSETLDDEDDIFLEEV